MGSKESNKTNTGLSIKWPDKSFNENYVSFAKYIVCSATEIATKGFFYIEQDGLKTLFLLFLIFRKYKSFLEVLSLH